LRVEGLLQETLDAWIPVLVTRKWEQREKIMIDFAAGIEAKNYGLSNTSDPRSLVESMKILLPLVAIAGILSFHVWVRSQNLQVGYESQRLLNQKEELLNIRKKLILEEQTLKDPRSLEVIARRDLGMIMLPVDQVILPPASEGWDTSASETLALGNISRSSDLKKPSPFN
jgi:cell division protein FtsL